mmetsp:Transcript_38832/g.105132  ORF Transcript_38832/g.105132 Transcript_38832/m.105132 type:complete len:284 (+) Transcript_38832:221-1072(+)
MLALRPADQRDERRRRAPLLGAARAPGVHLRLHLRGADARGAAGVRRHGLPRPDCEGPAGAATDLQQALPLHPGARGLAHKWCGARQRGQPLRLLAEAHDEAPAQDGGRPAVDLRGHQLEVQGLVPRRRGRSQGAVGPRPGLHWRHLHHQVEGRGDHGHEHLGGGLHRRHRRHPLRGLHLQRDALRAGGHGAGGGAAEQREAPGPVAGERHPCPAGRGGGLRGRHVAHQAAGLPRGGVERERHEGGAHAPLAELDNRHCAVSRCAHCAAGLLRGQTAEEPSAA